MAAGGQQGFICRQVLMTAILKKYKIGYRGS
jgi:hypothetical protein